MAFEKRLRQSAGGVEKLELIQYWAESAQEDLAVAEHLLDAGDFLWCLFVAHLAVEKMLKAAVVATTGEHAPLTHSLLRLAGIASLRIGEETESLFAELTRFNIEARYPKDKQALRDLCTAEYTKERFELTRRVMSWLQQEIRSRSS